MSSKHTSQHEKVNATAACAAFSVHGTVSFVGDPTNTTTAREQHVQIRDGGNPTTPDLPQAIAASLSSRAPGHGPLRYQDLSLFLLSCVGASRFSNSGFVETADAEGYLRMHPCCCIVALACLSRKQERGCQPRRADLVPL